MITLWQGDWFCCKSRQVIIFSTLYVGEHLYDIKYEKGKMIVIWYYKTYLAKFVMILKCWPNNIFVDIALFHMIILYIVSNLFFYIILSTSKISLCKMLPLFLSEHIDVSIHCNQYAQGWGAITIICAVSKLVNVLVVLRCAYK